MIGVQITVKCMKNIINVLWIVGGDTCTMSTDRIIAFFSPVVFSVFQLFFQYLLDWASLYGGCNGARNRQCFPFAEMSPPLLHNPHINWSTGVITEWGEGCLRDCFPSCMPLISTGQLGVFHRH